MNNRQNGKTFRRLCRALLFTSNGNNTLFVSDTRVSLNLAFDMALGMVSKISHRVVKGQKITLENGAFLMFKTVEEVSNGDQLKGLHFKTFVDDFEPSHTNLNKYYEFKMLRKRLLEMAFVSS